MNLKPKIRRFSKISTHALTWSATYWWQIIQLLPSFQLTHSRGVRLDSISAQSLHKSISTHALTWSATLMFQITHLASVFQLTHSRGVRRADSNGGKNSSSFQLTHSRGVRLNSARTRS